MNLVQGKQYSVYLMKKESTPNALIAESSPYLLQHANNPVNWLPWGDNALKLAQEQQKLMLISVGYSACHWCHVMERECFEDEEVATVMNLHFINVKVDREERPDIDQVYMSAVQLMNNGRGGWPLNCFALPDGRPIYGGTYFPKSNWLQLLRYLADYWQKNRDKALSFASQVTEAVRGFEFVEKHEGGDASADFQQVARAFLPLSQAFDLREGGTGPAPKFPLPVIWRHVLRYAHLSDEPLAIRGVRLTLDKMARGGIYDQIGGGFARYSTDERWFLPHFEKMLYDNAQLIGLYTEAWQAFGEELYRQTAEETVTCLLRDFRHPRGGFYSAFDADSEGVEGKFYVWTANEIVQALGSDAPLFMSYYNFSREGNWEHGRNIPYRLISDEDFAEREGISLETLKTCIERCKIMLQDIRSRRVHPGLDDKILASWNGLAAKALLYAGGIFNRKDWTEAGLVCLNFIFSEMVDGHRLNRSWKEGHATVNGFADDYAFVIEALIEAHSQTFDADWIIKAENLLEHLMSHFSHEPTGLFYYTSDLDPPLIARRQELLDNVIPSSNASIAHSLLTLGTLLHRKEYVDRSRKMLGCLLEESSKHASSYALWANLALRFAVNEPEVAIVGPDAAKLADQWRESYFPFQVLTGGMDRSKLISAHHDKWNGSKTFIYVCRDSSCFPPVTDAKQAFELAATKAPK